MPTSNTPMDPMETVHTLLTVLMGEEGLSRKIVDGVRDCLRVEAMQRIQDAPSASAILHDLKHYLDDRSVCCAGIKSLDRILLEMEKAHGVDRKETPNSSFDLETWLATERAHERFSQDLYKENGAELIFSCIVKHVADEAIQRLGFQFLRILDIHGPLGDGGQAAISMLSSPKGVNAALESMKHHMDNAQVHLEALVSLRSVGHLYWSRYYNHFPNAQLYVSLVESGAIDVLFSSIEYHSSNAQVVMNACVLLADIGLGNVDPKCRDAFLDYCDAHPDWRHSIDAARILHLGDLEVERSIRDVLYAAS